MSKKIIALVFSVCIILSGCKMTETINTFIGKPTQVENTLLTEKDSTVQFNIYPDGSECKDELDRYMFSKLNAEQKSIYIKLDNAINDMQTGYIDVGKCTQEELEFVFFCVRRDRPEYFWLPAAYYLRSVNNNMQIKFADSVRDWLCTDDERDEYEVEIKEQLADLLKTVNDGDSQYSKELKAHDWLVKKVTYDFDAVSGKSGHEHAWTVKGALIDGLAVCEGYSKALQIAFNMLGLESTVVTGVTDEPHMWNTVKIDGEWYHVDPTTNDSGDEKVHFFFNVTTEILLESRTIDREFAQLSGDEKTQLAYNFALPQCTSLENNYYVKEGTFIKSKHQLSSDFVKIICDTANQGKKSVEIGFDVSLGVSKMESVVNELGLRDIMDDANEQISKPNKIRKYGWTLIPGSSAIKVSWN